MKMLVLNLIITGLPSISYYMQGMSAFLGAVLNLIITGLPSILPLYLHLGSLSFFCFKPYYNWITFNILDLNKNIDFIAI